MNSDKRYAYGFTLIELMIAMVIAGIVLAAIYQAYRSQQKAYVTQQMVIEMQQNARSAMTLMKREIRMAGYKPAATDGIDNDGDSSLDDDDDDENGRKSGQEIGIMEAEKDRIMFRMDILPDDPSTCANGVEDGGIASVIDDPAECYDGLADDPGEEITYTLQPNAAGDGNDLVRITLDASGNQVINILAYDIEAIAFGYAYDSDEDGLLDTDGGGDVIWAYHDPAGMPGLNTNMETGSGFFGPQLLSPASGAPVIGAVRIWLLARTPHPIQGEVDSHTYQVGDQAIGPGTYNPGYRRTLQTATVYCRNLRF
jgi:prepilin-type N-terminal cleavage/methylation domain-containing protein